MEIPKINQTYNYFDDGKITEGRKENVFITEIIPFNDIDSETLTLWKHHVKYCNWLYDNKTDYFIKGYLTETKQEVIFARCLNRGWFSMGWWGGRLDVDGRLTNMLNLK